MSLHVVYTEGAYSVLGEWQRGRWVQFDVHLNLEKVRDGVYVSDDLDGPYTNESEAYARARELDAALAARTAGVEGTGSAASYSTSQHSNLSNQAHGFGVAGTLAPQPFDGDKFMAWLKELAQAVGPALVVNSPAGGLLRLAATDKLVEFYEKHCTHGVPPFDPTKPCVLTTADPTRTYCERCKNPHHACDHAAGVAVDRHQVVCTKAPDGS